MGMTPLSTQHPHLQDEAMAMLDSAMQDALVSPSGNVTEVDGSVEKDPLDAFLGDIIPGASMYDVDDFMSDVLPGAGIGDSTALDEDQLEDLDIDIGEEF